jgi:hypothetical protein
MAGEAFLRDMRDLADFLQRSTRALPILTVLLD